MGKKYEGFHSNCAGQSRGLFLNSCFPVVFNTNNPNENAVLIFPDEFDKYGLDFPDSLNWVLKYRP